MFELTEEQFEYCEEMERRRHDEKVREIEEKKDYNNEVKHEYNGTGNKAAG